MRITGLIPLVLVTLMIQQAFAETFLSGVASYRQLTKEYYLAALYTDQETSTAEPLVVIKNAKKMVLKIAANRWSQRSFENIWRQDLSINNDLTSDLELTNAISDFISFPREPLRKGDELTIQLTDENATEVLLNSEQVIFHRSNKLFYALLNTWLGNVPPSRLFLSDLLSTEAIVTSQREQHFANFNELSVKQERENIVSQWQEQDNKLRLAQQEAERAKQQKLEQAERLRAKLALAQKQEAERKQQLTLAKNTNTKTSINTATGANEKATLLAEQKLRTELEKIEAEAQLQQYMIDLYQWQIAQTVVENVEYPLWAKEFNLSGEVTIEFIVQADGQLMGISAITPSDSGLLGQALQSGLTQAAPFEAFNDRLTAKELILKVTHTFDPDEQAQPKTSSLL